MSVSRRFTLRGLFLAMTIIVVAMSRWASQLHVEWETRTVVESLGGSVGYETPSDSTSPSKTEASLSLPRLGGPHRNWAFGRHISHIHVPAERVTDDQLTLFSRLRHLHGLFSQPQFSDDSAASSSFPGDPTPVDTPSTLSRSTSLAEQANNPHDVASVTDRGLLALAQAKQLEALVLSNSQITDAGLQSLKSLPNLRLLHVMSPYVTDKAISELAQIESLRCLFIEGTAITPAGVRTLQRALPNCWIITGRFAGAAKAPLSP